MPPNLTKNPFLRSAVRSFVYSTHRGAFLFHFCGISRFFPQQKAGPQRLLRARLFVKIQWIAQISYQRISLASMSSSKLLPSPLYTVVCWGS